MCLAVPGKIESISDSGEILNRKGKVRFAGISKEISLGFVPDANVGDYVVVHVGFAISKIEEEEAQKTLDAIAQMRGALES